MTKTDSQGAATFQNLREKFMSSEQPPAMELSSTLPTTAQGRLGVKKQNK